MTVTSQANVSTDSLACITPLVLELDDTCIVVSSPRLKNRARMPRSIVHALVDLSQGQQDPLKALSTEAVRQLVDLGFLQQRRSTPGTRRPVPWDEWGDLAWAFHERVRDVPFFVKNSDAMRQWQHSLANADMPPPTSLALQKRRGEALLLPRVWAPLDLTFQRVLEGRRTCRSFTGDEIDVDIFSTLLHYTFGPLRFVDARELGQLQLRASVAAGARHEVSACIAVMGVNDVPSGLYIYDEIRHGIIPLDATLDLSTLDEWTCHQGFCDKAAFAVFTVADGAVMAWKYRNPRAYRHMMNNVGAFVQVFSMTAFALGLGAAATGAMADSEFDKLLSLERHREFTTFALSACVPVQRVSSGLPPDQKASSHAFHSW